MFRRREFTLLALGSVLLHESALALELDAPNPVEVSASLITSGQPTPKALAGLGALGVQAVVYLAPSSVPDAVKNEPDLLARQGIEFVHIPIPFDAPAEAHVIAVSRALERLNDKRVLVHCQVNLRASTMVFLHRVLTLKEEPSRAYESVTRVWSPEGPWRTLVIEQLKKHKVGFQPL
jgi:protein tyrosine phosphatase (PTP) superfamily phosphohydrolase (DUF442 family)